MPPKPHGHSWVLSPRPPISISLVLAAWEWHRHLCVTYTGFKVPEVLDMFIGYHMIYHLKIQLTYLDGYLPHFQNEQVPQDLQINIKWPQITFPFYHRQCQTWLQPSQMWAIWSLLTLCLPKSVPASFPIPFIQQGSWSCSWKLAKAFSHAKAESWLHFAQ